MRNKVLLISIAVFFQAASISSALILDQACDGLETGGYGAEKNIWVWQEFRPTTDNLEQVDLHISAPGVPSSVTVSFQVRDGEAVLWSTSFSAEAVGPNLGWFEIDTPRISLVPDHPYKLYLTSDLTYEQIMNGAFVMWDIIKNNPYSRGASVFDYYYGTNDDFLFRTWAVPEPATLLLLGFGAFVLRRKTA